MIEKAADKVKNLTGFGYGSKKVQEMIDNNANEDEIKNVLHKYRSSQENTAQATADVASSAAAIGTMFFVKQSLNKALASSMDINGKSAEDILKYVLGNLFKNKAGIEKKIIKAIKSSKTPIAIGAAAAALVGGIVKKDILKLNRVTTKQYKPEITDDMDKSEIKDAKRQAKKAKRNANLRNFTTGALNGLTAPVLAALGVAGAPIYAGINSLSRYFIGTKEDSGNKNFGNYIDNLKSSALVNGASAGIIALISGKSAHFNKVFDQNLNKAVENLKNKQLTQRSQLKTSYQQLEDVILGDEKIASIINNSSLSKEEKIEALTKENIFAVKFKQIQNSGDELTVALKESCNPSRTLDEAQALVEKTYQGQYKIVERVGTGTVAETYLAKDAQGKEVCIKMIKNGISEQKILQDKEKFLKMIDTMPGKSPEQKAFLKANVENIAQGVTAEVNLENELASAKKLAEVTKKAQVVKPITVKDNIYVMEKANGISLQSLIDGPSLRRQKKFLEGQIDKYTKKLEDETDEFIKGYYETNLTKYKEELQGIEKRLQQQPPKLTKDESKKLLETYQDVLVEQFSKVDKKGKTIHGDIHPGNIFIDVDAMRKGEKNFLTLIDTGNTINQNPQTALRFLNLTKYINSGDYENIAAFVLDGAKLPEGKTKEWAQEAVCKELKKTLFDNDTHIGPMSNDTMLAICDDIMQKLSIIPSDTQGNLLKSKNSANKSLEAFSSSFADAMFDKMEQDLEAIVGDTDNIQKLSKGQAMKIGTTATASLAELGITAAKTPAKQKLQEQKNLLKLSPKDRLKLKRSASTPKKNSEEYLNYVLKQKKKILDDQSKFTNMFLENQ